jgi:hypothetical protein
MKNILLATATLFVLGASTGRAQSACRSADAELDLRIRVTIQLVTSTDPDDVRARQHQQLPAVADSSVQAIFADSVCIAARDSYDAALPARMQQAGRRVYVIRVGDKYIVEDPTLKFGEFGLTMVLNQLFAVLGKFAS